jgi:DNA (cytosine-5)-methyltransferase 1
MKFNKGEWSELFVVASIFNNHKINIVNSDKYIKIVKIYFDNKKISYTISNSNIIKEREKIYQLYTSQEVKQFFDEINMSTGASFTLINGSNFVKKYDIPNVKEYKNKGDIDTNTLFPNESEGREVNFSVKSFIGSPPTLINSSQATNFIFEIQNFSGNMDKINTIATRSKIKDRLTEIQNCSTGFKIIGVWDNIFHENLLKIDTRFLEMLSHMLLNFYSSKLNTVSELVENTKYRDFSIDIVKLNMKRFLRAFALGMIPKEPWHGDNVTGGSIVVKKTGDLVAYTLYDMGKFDEFLYENCKFDTPSSVRHKFGKIYVSDDKYYFKLNLQIRFK